MPRLAAAVAAAVLLMLLRPPAPTIANPGDASWTEVSIPGEGEAGRWVLAPGSDVRGLAVASDSALYAFCQGLDYTLYKSTDGGYSWSDAGGVTDDIVAVAPVPGSAGVIYYATREGVAKSTDSGARFSPLAAVPGGAGSDNREITAIDVSGSLVAVATRDRDAGEYGGVYIWDETRPYSGWIDTGIGGYDVYAVAFSPNFATDQQLVAVITDETGTFVATSIGGAGWGQTVGNAALTSAGAPVAVNDRAAIAFPDDYSSGSGYVQFVAISTGGETGDVYAVGGVPAPAPSLAIDLDIGAGYGLSGVDVSGLAVSGSGTSASLLAGAAGRSDVYRSTDGGESWLECTKPPTGESRTCPVFDGSGTAYAATSGGGSAVSVSRDGGRTWNQTGLIDTDIRDITCLAPSPRFNEDNTLFMLTWGSGHSLWRTRNSGEKWERVYAAAAGSEIDRIELPPGYGSGSQVVYMAGSSDGEPSVWQSTDNGESFIRRSAPSPVDTWAVASEQALLIGGYDGSNSRMYRSTDSGSSYSAGAVAGGQPLNSIALSPGGYVLAGNANGWVYLSSDNGASFEPVPPGATAPPLSGLVSVAFDPGFGENHVVYAAGDTGSAADDRERIYRFRIGTSTAWERLDCTLPVGGMLGQLRLAPDGTLYATSFKSGGGMERCLGPASAFPVFETVTGGLGSGATLVGLTLCGNRLWAIDTTNVRLMQFNDTLAAPVTLISPQDGAVDIGRVSGEGVGGISLDWRAPGGATGYEWQVDDEAGFSTIPPGLKGNTSAISVRVPQLAPEATYYWRVRANAPLLSRWSVVWAFTTRSPVAATPTPEPHTPRATIEPSPTGTPAASPSPPPPPELSPSPAVRAMTREGTDWSAFFGGALIAALVGAIVALLVIIARTRRSE